MADMFADNQLAHHITRLICDSPEKYIKDNKTTWKSMTRLMFKNYSSIDVWNWFEEAMAEASDEDWFEKKWLQDKTFPKRDFDYKPKRKSVIKIDLRRSKLKKTINDNLKISDVIKSYGIKVKGNKCVCPFHIDTEPSLSFSDEKNVFNCFGCSAKGDVVEFIRRMEGGVKEDDNKTRS